MNTLSSSSRRTVWPYAIIATFVLFAAYIGYMVQQAMHSSVDLVSADYYQQELAYQQRMETVARTAALPVSVAVTYETAVSQLHLQLPPSFAGKHLEGNIHFFRPSDLKLDFTLPLQPSANLTQRINTQKIASGFWRIRVEFTADGQAYFVEKDLTI
jgi:nitrogen fixation protein FixH